MDIRNEIIAECEAVRTMLLDKNQKYGNSALDPVRIFSKALPGEQIRVRLDDKLSRLMHGEVDATEDTVKDLIGYLILLRIFTRLSAKQPEGWYVELEAPHG